MTGCSKLVSNLSKFAIVQCFTASGTLFCLKVAQAPAGFTFSTYSLFRVYRVCKVYGLRRQEAVGVSTSCRVCGF